MILFLASLLRLQRHRSALTEDLNHPVRHAFAAAFPVSMLLLASLLASLGVSPAWLKPLWLIAAGLQLLVTVWVMARWVKSGLKWASMTPIVFIPVVGNVVVPLGVPVFGHETLGWFFLGVGAFCWPVVLALLFARTAQLEFPGRLVPTWFITIAPPAVVGLGCLNLAQSPTLAVAAFGVASFFFALSLSLAGPIRALAFGMPFWALSFPLAAFSALAMALANADRVPAIVATALLALATVVILGLSLATLKGLRAGTLLVAEPGAPVIPVVPAGR
jgi:tellurite resistance protein